MTRCKNCRAPIQWRRDKSGRWCACEPFGRTFRFSLKGRAFLMSDGNVIKGAETSDAVGDGVKIGYPLHACKT